MTNQNKRPSDPTAARLNLSAVQDDDRLIESLRTGGAGVPASTELTRLVLAWKRDIDAQAFPAQPDVQTAEQALTAQAHPRSRRRILTPFAAAAAAFGIALSGVALLAHDSRPGDPLWGVTEVVYSHHARSVAAATQAEADLGLAQSALSAGSPDTARKALDRVSASLRSVSSSDGYAALSQQLDTLTAQLAQAPAAPAPAAPATADTPPLAPSANTPPPVPSSEASVPLRTVTPRATEPATTNAPAPTKLPVPPPTTTVAPTPSPTPSATGTTPAPAPPPPTVVTTAASPSATPPPATPPEVTPQGSATPTP